MRYAVITISLILTFLGCVNPVPSGPTYNDYLQRVVAERALLREYDQDAIGKESGTPEWFKSRERFYAQLKKVHAAEALLQDTQ